ncbi:LysR family transcriptional regulator [Corallococcus praedator]|uniref:LysR family transcriptional regulator n=1 Tax=Corallococcus praedator TaxID=2316724 RepID=A0ABX9QDZ2_9BACT|nr:MULTISPECIES: LysR family transcriptional regulator [Corallococcus]RKH20358.1 LysR family transcriptional regulator [Corallococcus sp. CA047B]RKH30281.1 LysR family transcriptional regulator [Corallococcus sp. CA031C]RKI00667.1 LysR family transcriptional regulator [Corallococcus praedator]
MISPADMVLFARVVREGSFTRAARQLGITKQTVSERISKLEEQLGVRLLERTTRRLRVTGAGATYYDRCAAIAAQIDEANSEAQQQEAEPVGLLRVSSPMLYGRRYLAPVVSEFLGRYPKARVELVLADRRINLIEEGLDVAIHIGTLDDSSLVARKLGEGPMYLVASPGFLAQYGTPSARELRDARCIGFSAFETWSVEGVKSRIDPVLTVNDLEVACDAAIAGVGIACVPTLLCQDAVREGRLKVLFGPKPALLRSVHAVYPSRLNLPTKVRLFVETLATRVAPMLPLHGAARRRRS